MAHDLTTLANVKQWIGIASANDDALLARLVKSASSFIEAWLNRHVMQQSYTHTADGRGGIRLPLPQYPVTAVASVNIDGFAIPQSTSPSAPGWVVAETGILSLRGGYKFATGVQNVTVTYTAGYAVVPSEIEQACIELVALSYKGRDRIGVSSKSANGESVSFTPLQMTDEIRDMLNPFRKVALS